MKERKLFSKAFLNRLTNSAKLSTPHDEDIRAELRQFRAKQSGRPSSQRFSRTPSPLYYSPSSTVRELPYPLNTLHKTTALTNSRPQSSNKRTLSIIDTVREVEINSPKESSESEFKKARSINRLHRGLQVRQGTPPELQGNPLHTYGNISDSDHTMRVSQTQLDRERNELDDFTSTLQCKQEIKFELELNHSIVRTSHTVNPSNLGLGSFYKINEKVREISTYSSIDSEAFILELKSMTEHLREVLRSLKFNSMSNEAVILDIFWRGVVKLGDTIVKTHAEELLRFKEEAEHSKQSIAYRHLKATEDFKQSTEEESAKLIEKISKLQAKLHAIQLEKREIEGKLIEREYELSRVTHLDVREDSVRDMNSLIKKLNTFIKDSESESYRQAVTLKSISDIMTLAEKLDDKVPLALAESQTDWTVRDICFPLLAMPLISIHPLHFFEGVETERPATEREMTALFENVITRSTGLKPIWRELLEVVDGINPVEIWNQLHNMTSSSSKLMLKLLGKDGLMPKQLTAYLARLIKQFETVSKGENSLGLGMISDMVTALLPKNNAESLISLLNIENETLNPIDILLLRFVLAVEKTRKPFQHFASQFASLSRERLHEIFFEKVKVTATPHEVDRYFDSIAIKNSISMHSFHESVKFDERLIKAKSAKVSKFDFLLAATHVWQEEFWAILRVLRSTSSDRLAFSSLAETVGLTETNTLLALLKTPIETDCLVLAELLEFTPIKFNERKKKELKKKKKK
mmetsp:Transcript_9814/g.19316  ORF Transcript_9814/g.19316 Transcript_9814/m.19316 type:complete len:751 (-) Transcript_9814:2139-4391(-)